MFNMSKVKENVNHKRIISLKLAPISIKFGSLVMLLIKSIIEYRLNVGTSPLNMFEILKNIYVFDIEN